VQLRNDFDVATTAGAVTGMLTAGIATGALGVLAGTFSQMSLAAAAAYWAVVKLPATGATAPHEAQPAQVRTCDFWLLILTDEARLIDRGRDRVTVGMSGGSHRTYA
jgi:hypothetical protein